MDILPPSYEAATGEPGIHNQKNPNSKSVSPTAPPAQNDEIITVDPETTQIFPRPHRSNLSSNVQPNNQHLDPETSPKPETIYLYRRRNTKCTPCTCYFIIFIFVVFTLVVIIGLLTANNEKSKNDFSQISYSEDDRNTAKEREDKWWKDNQDMIKEVQDRANKVLEDRRNNPYLWNND